MPPKSTLAQAQALGLATPQPNDQIHRGDDAITENARWTADALADAAAAAAAAAAADAEARRRARAEDALQAAGDDAIIYAVVDKDGRRTVLELGTDGNLTPRAAGLLGKSTAVVSSVGAALGLESVDGASTDLSYAVVDKDGRVTELALDAAGRIPARILTAWAARMGTVTSGGSSGTDYPSRDWACWGDSFTGNTYPSKLATALGVEVLNGGRGGQKTLEIAARQGGTPARVTLTGNTIPASGAVTLTAITNNPNSAGDSRLGTIAGVTGVLARSADGTTNTFTRSADGTAVAVPANTHFLTTDGVLARNRVQVLWTGRNDVRVAGQVTTPIDEILPRVQSMLDYLTPAVRRAMVLEVAPGETDVPGSGERARLDALNAALQSAFPQYWVPIATWLRTDEAAVAAGVTLTAEDRTDIANGLTPRSLRSDGLHLNDAGNTAVVARLKTEATKRGWI